MAKEPSTPRLGFVCEARVMARSLKSIASIVEKKMSIAILQNVRIEASDSGVRLTGTDLDIALSETFDATVDGPFATTVSAHLLNSLFGSFEDGAQARVTLTDKRLGVQCAGSRSHLVTQPASDFPMMEIPDWPSSFTLPAAQLRRAIEAVSFAMSDEELLYNLHGIYLHQVDGKVRLVATDKGRVAYTEIDVDAGLGEGIIIPAKTTRALRRMLDGIEGDVAVNVGEGKMAFAFGSWRLVSKAVDGVFPGYMRPYELGADKAVKVDPALFDAAVARAVLLSSEKTRVLRCAIEPDRMTLTIGTPDLGEAIEELPCEYEGEPITIGLNARFLRDNLAQLRCDTAEMLLLDANNPILLIDPAPSAPRYAQAAFSL